MSRFYAEVGRISLGEDREESDTKSNSVTSQLLTSPDQPETLQSLIWSSGSCPQRAWLWACTFHFVIPANSCPKKLERLSSEYVTHSECEFRRTSASSFYPRALSRSKWRKLSSQIICYAAPGFPWTALHVSAVWNSLEKENLTYCHVSGGSRGTEETVGSRTSFITTTGSLFAALIPLSVDPPPTRF